MIRSFFRGLVAVATLTLLAGCSNPETPQEVAAAFWQAMAENDAGDVMEYSTLAESAVRWLQAQLDRRRAILRPGRH